ncbi:MAG: long-chain fatty acid--CoA ligase [Bacteroidetes bacterium]|nr:MAG: long-chain fatty acid--CoA ligase [Bacteroidota bacterium]
MESVRRTFDILTYAEKNFSQESALAVKRNGKWERFSTADYRKQVDNFSLGLLSMGFKKGDKIATVTNNRPEWNFIDFGMSQIGVVHVGIYPTISEKEYLHILSHSESRILIVANKDLYDLIYPIFEKIDKLEEIYTIDEIEGVKNWIEISQKGIDEADKYRDLLKQNMDEVKPDDLLTLIYTSGTTGLSKGVMLTHNNVVSNVKIAQTCVPYSEVGDEVLSFLPLCHILERTGNYLWQSIGAKIHYSESIEDIGDDIREIKVKMFITVPRVFEKIYDKITNKGRELSGIKKELFFWAVNLGNQLKANPAERSAWYNFKLKIADKLIFSKWREALGGELKGVISGGAALQPRLARIFRAAGVRVQEGYGLTETSPIVSATMADYPGVKWGSAGLIPDSIKVKIAEDGEILVKGDNVMVGYYKDPEKTREVLTEDGWFHTGDIGNVDENNMLSITDRKKEIFKLSGGKYVAPHLVENTFKESQFIENIMVVGENEKFTGALISPNFEFLHNWCHLHKIKYRDNKDLIYLPVIIERYQKEVEIKNKELGHIEQVKVFRLVCEAWTAETGELSPTQKLKRRVVRKKYDHLLQEIYPQD